jgi:hypothetical protein
MKSFSWLTLFLVIGLASTAQTYTAIKAGAALSNLHYKFASNNQARITWFAGFMVNLEVQEQFFVRTELLYSRRGYQVPATATSIKGNMNYGYLSIPLLAGYTPVKNLSVMAGPELGYMLSAKAKDANATTDVIGFVQNRFSVDANTGLSYALTPELTLDAHFLVGLTALYSVTYADANGNTIGPVRDGFNRVLQVGLVYKMSGH